MTNNEEQRPTIAVPKFFKDYDKGLDAFKRNLDNLKRLADNKDEAAQTRLNEINRSMIFINKVEDNVLIGEAIYANGKFYGVTGGLKSSDNTIDICNQEADTRTNIRTHGGIATMNDTGDAGSSNFVVTNEVGNVKKGTTVEEGEFIYRILRDMLQKSEDPRVIRLPNIALSGFKGGKYRVGDSISATLVNTTSDGLFKGNYIDSWNPDLETPANCEWSNIRYGGGEVKDNTLNYTFMDNTNISVSVSGDHSEARCELKDSAGAIFNSASLIPAATKTSKITAYATYHIYYGTVMYSAADSPTGGMYVKDLSELTETEEDVVNSTPQGTCTIAELSTKPMNSRHTIAIAVPETNDYIWEIMTIYQEPMHILLDPKTKFRKQTTQLEDINKIKYTVYYCDHAITQYETKYSDIQIKKQKK